MIEVLRYSCFSRNIKDIPAINGLRRSEVLGDNLSARYIHNNHKLASLKQCDYYGLRSQNITKYFCELLQEVDGRISFYCCLYRYLM